MRPRSTTTPLLYPSRRAERERSILRATLEELAAADYGALSVDNIAKRAGVNKTTVYRRWPTKAGLVGSAITALADQMTIGPSAGSLRADLLEIGRRMLNLALSIEGQGLARLGILRRPEPELAGTLNRLRAGRQKRLEELLDAAVERGELSKDADLAMMLDMLGGLLHVRLFMKNQGVDELVVAHAVDLLLYGILRPRSPVPKSSARRRTLQIVASRKSAGRRAKAGAG
jgi:AcrR family transcriptional regulator